jgi:hypothetical protein
MIHPVFQRFGIWHWLVECECGNESIIRSSSAARSCGCLKGKNIARFLEQKQALKEPEVEGPAPVVVEGFHRGRHCLHRMGKAYVFECKHYDTCLTQRVEENMKHSTRYADLEGTCYELGREEELVTAEEELLR